MTTTTTNNNSGIKLRYPLIKGEEIYKLYEYFSRCVHLYV